MLETPARVLAYRHSSLQTKNKEVASLIHSFTMSTSDDKPTPAEPDTTNNLAKSFEDRLSFPADSKPKPSAPDLTTTSSSKFNWADEVETPIEESAKKVGDGEKDQTESSLDMAQTDGSSSWLNGSAGLDEPEFDVNVKLADLQEDPNNPLYSVKSFAELNL